MSVRHLVFDGRVFATEAADRGMGRYVDHLVTLAAAAGNRVTVLLPAGLTAWRARAGIIEHALLLDDDPMLGTTQLNRWLRDVAADTFVDATPFLPPMRYDIYACPVIAVLYDLIPMRFPTSYFGLGDEFPLDVYVNGLARVRKADQVIAISHYVSGHARRYLGIPRDNIVVIEPGVGPEYAEFGRGESPQPPSFDITRGTGSVMTIQGAHRSKNFPAAIPFLERLSVAASCYVDVLVPTPTQHTLVDQVRDPGVSRIRLWASLSEARKLDLQRQARVIAHLSLDEGYGIPLAEALYVGRPVVCIDNAINREVLGNCADPRAAGVILLDDPTLASKTVLDAAAAFVRAAPGLEFAAARRDVVDLLEVLQARTGASLMQAIDAARAHFDRWRANVGMSVVTATEFGSCGVSDYSHALMRGGAPRYALLLGRASRALQLTPQLRLLPLALLDDIRTHTAGALFNLAVSDSLTRAFDAIAERSAAQDVLVIHDAGSYVPGLLMQAAASGDERALFDRYLAEESGEVQSLAKRWLAQPSADPAHSGSIFLDIDRQTRSAWLRRFRGRIVSHHGAFAGAENASDVLALLAADSEIRKRARYAPMPIDARATPGIARLAWRMRWALGVARHDLLVCCAGSVVRGKYLDVVARVISRINAERATNGTTCAITLLLAGRVLDDALFASLRAEFAARSEAGHLLAVVEGNETRYDALLMACDVVVAFREQRRIQMSHSYVRALALGRPVITNSGAGFDDAGVSLVCDDDDLERNLHDHLLRVRDSRSLRLKLSRDSRSIYQARHTVSDFFVQMNDTAHDAAAV